MKTMIGVLNIYLRVQRGVKVRVRASFGCRGTVAHPTDHGTSNERQHHHLEEPHQYLHRASTKLKFGLGP